MSKFSQYQEFIHLTRYSRWLWNENRRESWPETVNRYTDYMMDKVGVVDDHLKTQIHDFIYDMKVMPSMRALMAAGQALELSNIAGYNCSYLVFDSLDSFSELLFILMNGTGVGFSVERRYIDQLPKIPTSLVPVADTFVVQDSKIGWALSVKHLIDSIYQGQVPSFDFSEIRAAGEPLKTFGGRASGPQPLVNLIQYIIAKAEGAKGRGWKPIEVHDIACMVATCVVVGGVRRSALISLSDLDDDDMRDAKSGEWWVAAPERALANNSAVYEGDIDRLTFDNEWKALVASGSGERGIFNRTAARLKALECGRSGTADYGTNPCGEILLLPYEFCNLTEVVARFDDTLESLREKVELATIMGTFQTTLTDFEFIRPIWRMNVEEERLLGVSITGIFDCPAVQNAEVLIELRDLARDTNLKWSKILNINPSVSITCVKPSGTVSQLTDSASGIHPRYAPFYIRRIRNDSKDPVTRYLSDLGFPVEVDSYNPSARVFSFPMKAPPGATCREDVGPIDHLQIWALFRKHWCDHNPSITVNIKPDEWGIVGDWVYENFHDICGISFLPYSTEDHTYVQLPYEEIDEGAYLEMLERMPTNINWEDLIAYEDNGKDITAGRELACSAASGCEL